MNQNKPMANTKARYKKMLIILIKFSLADIHLIYKLLIHFQDIDMHIVNDKLIQEGNPIVGSTIPSPPMLFDHKVSTIQMKD